jgi:hypothetical protein
MAAGDGFTIALRSSEAMHLIGAKDTWPVIFSGDLDELQAIQGVAVDIANRLTQTATLEVAIARSSEQTGFPNRPRWLPFGVAQGHAGLGIMCSYFDACFPGQGWDLKGHFHLRAAAESLCSSTFPPMGLFSGMSGLGFSAWCLSGNRGRYKTLLARVDELLLRTVADAVRGLSRRHEGLRTEEFDLISGLTGIGAYLLCRKEDQRCSVMLEQILRALVDLSNQRADEPRWFTPADCAAGELGGLYPEGNMNCGLAHGIPGPLSLLAIARGKGFHVDGMPEAIDNMADWLMRHSLQDEWGINWPAIIPVRKLAPDAWRTEIATSRSAWCYGSPGVARSLWLAGETLDDNRYRTTAIAAIETVLRRPVGSRGIDAPTFCHGVAGLLQITSRFYQDTGLPELRQGTAVLIRQLMLAHRAESLLGYQDIEPGLRYVDDPGLLDGAAGIALTLLAASSAKAPVWDRLFLLA